MQIVARCHRTIAVIDSHCTLLCSNVKTETGEQHDAPWKQILALYEMIFSYLMHLPCFSCEAIPFVVVGISVLVVISEVQIDYMNRDQYLDDY